MCVVEGGVSRKPSVARKEVAGMGGSRRDRGISQEVHMLLGRRGALLLFLFCSLFFRKSCHFGMEVGRQGGENLESL